MLNNQQRGQTVEFVNKQNEANETLSLARCGMRHDPVSALQSLEQLQKADQFRNSVSGRKQTSHFVGKEGNLDGNIYRYNDQIKTGRMERLQSSGKSIPMIDQRYYEPK